MGLKLNHVNQGVPGHNSIEGGDPSAAPILVSVINFSWVNGTDTRAVAAKSSRLKLFLKKIIFVWSFEILQIILLGYVCALIASVKTLAMEGTNARLLPAEQVIWGHYRWARSGCITCDHSASHGKEPRSSRCATARNRKHPARW